jgi:hypothetical protein
VVVAFHGGLRGRVVVQDMLIDWLEGATIRGSDVLAALERLIAGGATSWQVPAVRE